MAEKIEIILNLIRGLIESHKVHDNDNVQKAISLILKSKGQIRISTLIEELPITERTLERNFKLVHNSNNHTMKLRLLLVGALLKQY